MLDRDLAALYETETKALNLAVKRNSKRFPKDFMFQLTKDEFDALRFKIETLEETNNPLRLQNAWPPYIFSSCIFLLGLSLLLYKKKL